MQTPPQFSAVKIAGNRAYDLARDGETVDIPPREVEIGRFDLIGWNGAGRTLFEIECGKGTYVRSLARDMGRDLGCFGHIAELRRVEVEPFAVDELGHRRGARSRASRRPMPRRKRPIMTAMRRSTPISSKRLPRSTACRRSPSPTMRPRASGSAMR